MFAICADNCASAITAAARRMADEEWLSLLNRARGRPAQWRAVRLFLSEFKVRADLCFASTDPALRDAILERC
jgi:hypothetical protein